MEDFSSGDVESKIMNNDRVAIDFSGQIALEDHSQKQAEKLIARRYLCYGFFSINGVPPCLTPSDNKRPVVVAIRDIDSKIPMLHLGMEIAVALCRGAIIDDASRTPLYYNFEYTVLFVKYAGAASLNQTSLYLRTLADTNAQDIMAHARRLVLNGQRSSDTKVFFVEKKYRASALAIARNSAHSERYASLLSQVASNLRMLHAFQNSFSAYFDAKRTVLAPNAVAVDLIEAAQRLSIDGGVIARANLPDISLLLAEITPDPTMVRALFYGAMPLREQQLFGEIFLECPGARFGEVGVKRARALLLEYLPDGKERLARIQERLDMLSALSGSSFVAAAVADNNDNGNSRAPRRGRPRRRDNDDGQWSEDIGSETTEEDERDDDGDDDGDDEREDEEDNSASQAIEVDEDEAEAEEDEAEIKSNTFKAAFRILKLAHEIYRTAFFFERAKRRKHFYATAFGSLGPVRAALQRLAHEMILPYQNDELHTALEFLLRARVWYRLYAPDNFDMTTADDIGPEGLLVSTMRDAKHESELALAIHQLQPYLIKCGVARTALYIGQPLFPALYALGAAKSQMAASSILWIQCTGAQSALVATATTASHTKTAVDSDDDDRAALYAVCDVDSFLAPDRNEDGQGARSALAITTLYDLVVVCDAHMLSTHEALALIRLLTECKRARRNNAVEHDTALPLHPFGVVFCGDTNACAGSFFSIVCQSQLFPVAVVDDLPVDAPMAPGSTATAEARIELRRLIEVAAQNSSWRAALVNRVFSAPVALDICFLTTAQRIVERITALPNAHGVHCRYIIVAHGAALPLFFKAMVSATTEMAEVSHILALRALFKALADAPQHAIDSIIHFGAPYVAFRRRCQRITAAWIAKSSPSSLSELYSLSNMTSIILDPRADLAAFSLCDPHLFIELEGSSIVDHRVCCRTWSPTVMRPVCHRGELRSQSFPIATEALPLADGRAETVLCFVENSWTFEDFYDAAITATPYAGAMAFAGVRRDTFARGLDARRSTGRTMLGHFLEQIRDSIENADDDNDF